MISWNKAPITAGITPKAAMNIRIIQMTIPIMTACLAIFKVSRLISIDVVTFLRSFCSKTISAASLATVPEPTPIEIPMSAVANAGVFGWSMSCILNKFQFFIWHQSCIDIVNPHTFGNFVSNKLVITG